MTREIFLIILFAAALLAVCWMLTEYWLKMKQEGMHEGLGRLRFGSRTVFALTHFWKKMDDARDIPNDLLRREMGLADNGLPAAGKKQIKGRMQAR